MIRLKRAYDDVGQEDGLRFVVDRVWPRGVKKEALALDGWLRDVAPSDELRRWFGHDPERWDEFVRRYHTELDAKPDAWQPILQAAQAGDVTLVFGARDRDLNNAVALKAYLEERLSAEGSKEA